MYVYNIHEFGSVPRRAPGKAEHLRVKIIRFIAITIDTIIIIVIMIIIRSSITISIISVIIMIVMHLTPYPGGEPTKSRALPYRESRAWNYRSL